VRHCYLIGAPLLYLVCHCVACSNGAVDVVRCGAPLTTTPHIPPYRPRARPHRTHMARTTHRPTLFLPQPTFSLPTVLNTSQIHFLSPPSTVLPSPLPNPPAPSIPHTAPWKKGPRSCAWRVVAVWGSSAPRLCGRRRRAVHQLPWPRARHVRRGWWCLSLALSSFLMVAGDPTASGWCRHARATVMRGSPPLTLSSSPHPPRPLALSPEGARGRRGCVVLVVADDLRHQDAPAAVVRWYDGGACVRKLSTYTSASNGVQRNASSAPLPHSAHPRRPLAACKNRRHTGRRGAPRRPHSASPRRWHRPVT
jgi:hypothetical protein